MRTQIQNQPYVRGNQTKIAKDELIHIDVEMLLSGVALQAKQGGVGRAYMQVEQGAGVPRKLPLVRNHCFWPAVPAIVLVCSLT